MKIDSVLSILERGSPRPLRRRALAMVLAAALAAPAASSFSAEDVSSSITGSYLAAGFAYSHSQFEAADAYMASALAVRPEDPMLLERGLAFKLMLGEFDGAWILAERVLALHAKAGESEAAEDLEGVLPLALLALSVRDMRRGEWEGAEKRIAALEAAGAYGHIPALLQAWVKAGKSGAAAGAAVLESADTAGEEQEEDPSAVFLRFHQALLNDLAGRTEAAQGGLERTIEALGEPNYRLYQLVGNFYERHGQKEKAEALYQKFLEEKKEDLLLRDYHLRAGTNEPPAPMIADASAGAAEALLALTDLLDGFGQAAEVHALLQLARMLNPSLDLAKVKLANTYENAGDPVSAGRIYDEIAEGSPLYLQSRIWMALGEEKRGNYYKAARMLKRLAKRYPDEEEIYVNLGNVHRRAERFEDAAEAYGQAIERVGEIKPYHWLLFYYRGVAYERSKQWEKAEPDFLKALELEPDQADVLNYLAYSWLEMNRYTARATEMLERAIALRPSEAHIIDSYAWAMFKRGEYATAVAYLERAIELMPYDATLNEHLGDVYWRVGRELEARFQWQRALTFGPDAPEQLTLQNKLMNGLPPAESATHVVETKP